MFNESALERLQRSNYFSPAVQLREIFSLLRLTPPVMVVELIVFSVQYVLYVVCIIRSFFFSFSVRVGYELHFFRRACFALCIVRYNNSTTLTI